jgi:energy-converting hydrogenase Eha subunit F
MRKTLLIAAAALAAGVISSQAQVYSQNIVGYVNTTLVAGYVNVVNPLDNSAGNSLTNTISNPGGVLDGAYVYIWNGTGYTVDSFDSSSPSGFDGPSGSALAQAPVIAPGQFVFLLNNTGVKMTNTFVGTVHVDGAGASTNVVGLSTNVLGNGYNFVSSKIPVAGDLITTLGLSNPGGVLDGAYIYTPNIDATGAFHGYVVSSFDSSSTTGYDGPSGSGGYVEPILPVGQGVIILNNTGAPYTWVQSY